jgi:hypothetical protein
MDGAAIAALPKPKALLVAENLCLRQQLIVLCVSPSSLLPARLLPRE